MLGSCSIPVKSEWFLSKAPVAPGGHGSTQGTNHALQCCFLIASLKIPCHGALLISCLIPGHQERTEQERNLPWLSISQGE